MRAALITGTSTGIGRACTERLAERGWTVFAGVRREEDGKRLQSECAGDIRPVILDVSNRDDIRRVTEDVERDVGTGGLQALVNNAGVGVGGPFEFLSEDEWRYVFEINFFGVVALTLAAFPSLRAGNGRVVHIGSIGGRAGSPGLGPYNASKFAIEGMADAQRFEFARLTPPMHVSVIEPGEVKSEIWAKADDSMRDLERKLDGNADAQRRYEWLLMQTKGFIDEGRSKGVPPSKVADAVEHALSAAKPKARYLVGPDAKLVGNVALRLPDGLRDALLRFGAGRWEKRGRKLRT